METLTGRALALFDAFGAQAHKVPDGL
jgi:hypothetical protein